jgi:hypothetical protein
VRYAATSAVPVTAGGSAEVLVRTKTTDLWSSATPFVGAARIGSGLLVVAGDSNVFSDDSDGGYATDDNGRLGANLCAGPLAAADGDEDGVVDDEDNCSGEANPDQRDTDRDGQGDECDSSPGSTAGCRVTNGGHVATLDGDRASFGGTAQARAARDARGQQTYLDHAKGRSLRLKSRTVTSVICSGTRATIRGEGETGGDAVTYRIDVTDNGEPGSEDTYRLRLSNGADSGERRLDGGNVQVAGGS